MSVLDRLILSDEAWARMAPHFGIWNNAFRRFSRWSAKGVWQRIFAAMAE